MQLARDEALPQPRRAGTKTNNLPTLCFPPRPAGFHSQHWVFVWSPISPITRGQKIFFLTPFRLPLSSLTILKRRFAFSLPPQQKHTRSPYCLLPTLQERADVDLKEVKSTSAAFLWSPVIHRAGWGESTGKEGGEKATRDILYNSKAQRSVQTGNCQPS